MNEWPVTLDIPVAWGDMDAFAHVNNTVYLRWFECARIAYFEKLGLGPAVRADACGPILAETHCRFRIPLTYPDTVTAGARITDVSARGFIMQYEVASRRAGALAAEGGGRIVWFDYRKMAKAALPGSIREKIHALEKR